MNLPDTLETFLRPIASPETLSYLDEAVECFENLNYYDYQALYDEILMLEDVTETMVIFEQILNVTRNMLDTALHQHGVFLSDYAEGHQLLKVLQTLVIFDDQADPDAVLNVLDSDGTDEEKFAEVLELLTDDSAENQLVHIERVNPGLIRKMRELMRVKASHEDTSEEAQFTQVHKVVEVKRLFEGIEKSILMRQLEAGLAIGLKFQLYMEMLWPHMVELADEALARELLGMAVISEDYSDHPMEGVKQTIGKYSADLDQISRITNCLTEMFVKLKQTPAITKHLP